MSSDTDNQPMLAIGAVARATGIPVETLRTWERRYGFPNPARTDGGHRLYAADVVERLRAIEAALAAGHRASSVVPLPLDDLRKLVNLASRAPSGASNHVAPDLRRWVRIVRDLDGAELGRDFAEALERLGPVRFVTEHAGVFLDTIGQAWATGQLDVYHEHFASEQLRDFLAGLWRPMAARARGPLVLLTTLPSERHQLGLHMAAVVAAHAGCAIAYLGCDTPLTDIERSVEQLGVSACLVSVSRAAEPARTRAHLVDLRARIDESVAIVVGGTGAPADVVGVRTIDGFALLEEWCRALVRQSAA